MGESQKWLPGYRDIPDLGESRHEIIFRREEDQRKTETKKWSTEEGSNHFVLCSIIVSSFSKYSMALNNRDVMHDAFYKPMIFVCIHKFEVFLNIYNKQ